VRLFGWGVAATVVALVHNRLWATPNLSFFVAITDQLGQRPFGDGPEADYLLTNLGLPVMARAVGQTAPHEYARLHLVVLVAALGGCVALAHRRHGYRVARTLTVLLAAAPGTTVVMQWLGQPDALTFPLAVALTLLRRRLSLTLAGVLLGLTHPEQAVIIVVVAAVVRLAVDAPSGDLLWPLRRLRPERLRSAAADLAVMGGGVVVGRLVTEIYLRVNDIEILRPRSRFLSMGADVFLEHHLLEPGALLYLLWGPLWLVVVGVAAARVSTRRGESPRRTTLAGQQWAVLTALGLLLLVPVMITLDETRVYAMLTAPLLVGAAVVIGSDPTCRALRGAGAAAALLVVTAVVPGGFTAGTATWSTDIPPVEMARFLRDGTHPDTLDAWLMTPFDFVIPAPLRN
jgi:hypothetical protein